MLKYKNYEVEFVINEYQVGGGMAIQMMDVHDGMPIAICTVNIKEVDLAEDEVLIKNYSENEGMLEWFKENGFVKEVVDYVDKNFVTIPKVKLNMEEIEKYTSSF